MQKGYSKLTKSWEKNISRKFIFEKKKVYFSLFILRGVYFFSFSIENRPYGCLKNQFIFLWEK
jgi:hypothetical protein